jgi:hypothetical protein
LLRKEKRKKGKKKEGSAQPAFSLTRKEIGSSSFWPEEKEKIDPSKTRKN